ncbi:hypothetical protein [Roseivivax isoporae]|nr:hypothetical protein [Roseivivax isoporae]
MPVTSFSLLVLSVLGAALLTVWALSAFGIATVLPVVLVLALVARWGMGHVPFDDPQG